MLKYVLAASFAAAVQAQDCSSLTYNADTGCQNGQTLVDIATLTACKSTLCGIMDPYALAHGADMTKKLAGSGYGCEIEDWDGTGVGDTICMSSGPSPTPPPTPPTPTPPTPPGPPGPTPEPGPTPVPGPKDNSSSGGIDGGVIFLIVFFVGFAVYFAAGMAYMHKVKGATGVEMVPNLEFWKDLPNLIKDGVFFLKNKVTGGGYSSV